VPVPRDVRFTSIQVGDNHVMALTTEGKVFAWGDNTHGQVGISDALKNHQEEIKSHKYVYKPVCVFPDQPDLRVIQI
jgi:alpha-tubulin suppressor-like RCC1 family protein